MVFSDFESIDTPQWYLSICIIDTLLLPGPIDIDDYVLFMAFGPMQGSGALSLSISIRLVFRSILIVSSIQDPRYKTPQHSETSTIDRVLSIDANASHRRTSGQESLIPPCKNKLQICY